MELQRGCVGDENLLTVLEQLFRSAERGRIKFDHQKSEEGQTFSTVFYVENEPVTIRLIKNKRQLTLECACACHGSHQYDLHEKRLRGKAGPLYDLLFLRLQGILPG